ncbi:MAG: aminomethyltransferase [Sphingomonas taxi]|uniref:Aminomethyltransferase n=1 Tax=Sphingomonas taxi TaxID=1549858 RepID=A0A2W5P1A8_9SPHN|nr:MAG: aminomethyltransferase [Sphingomonas taxi]
MSTPFTETHGFPYYDEPATYVTVGGRLRQWEHSGWKPESLSWKESCYIHTGLSGPVVCVDGPDADAFIAYLSTNSLKTFPEGTMRHAVMCTDDGLVAAHGILQRYDNGLYRHYAAGPWALYKALTGQWNVRAWMEDMYLTQIAGPKSREALERASGEDLGDIAFLRYRRITIAGKDVEVGRIGMSGNLAYEVRGPIEDGAAVYDAIYQSNREIGIERLGWRTYLVNHVEGGFPQANWTFGMAMIHDPDFRAWVGEGHFALHPQVTGSVDPADTRARLRNPFEVNWGSAVKFDHDFLGRAALERIKADPKQRRTVTLRWNAEDVIDIFASLYREGEEYRTMDLPSSPTWAHGLMEHADRVLLDGALVGVSSGSIYSYYFRENLSMGCIDQDLAVPGTELVVQWGDHGRRLKDVRVTVDRFPYLTEGRNSGAA